MFVSGEGSTFSVQSSTDNGRTCRPDSSSRINKFASLLEAMEGTLIGYDSNGPSSY